MQLTIFKRLSLGYGVFVVLLIGLGVYVAVQLNRLNQLTWAVVMRDGETVRLAESLDSMAVSLARFEKKHLVTGDAAFFKRFHEIRARFLSSQLTMRNHLETNALRAILDGIGTLSTAYFALIDREREGMPGDGRRQPDVYHDRKAELLDQIRLSLQTIMGEARQARDQKILLSSHISVTVIRVGIITIGIGGLIGLFVSFINARRINHAIQRLQLKTHDVANSRFSTLPPIESPPEIAALTRDFNRMCDRLQELNDMKEDFIYHVSHELRTPLTAIREASSMLLEGCFRERPDSQDQLLTIVKDECDRLIKSINRMLDLSRMEAQMMDYAFKTIAILPVVRSCILKLAPIAVAKEILLELTPNDALPKVHADPDRLYQLLENLLGNALKFTEAGGKVCIALQPDIDNSGFLQVQISDTGCGIPQNALKTIFDKFRRIDSGQETERGTGLGLSIAKHIVMAHGGKNMGHKPARKRKRFLLYLAGGLMGGLLLGACTIGRPPIGNHTPPPSDSGRHLLEGDVLLLEGEYEGARREACLQLERFPGQAEDRAFFLLGMVWVHPDNPRQDIHRAEVCFRRIEDRYPDSPLVAAATTWRALIAQLGENEQSLAQMQTASLALKQQLEAEAAKRRLLEERLQQMKAIDLNLE